MKFTVEQIKQAKQAKSAEEILAMAKANNFEMSEAEAKFVFDELHKQGELTDDELLAVVGGKGDNPQTEAPKPYQKGQKFVHKVKKNQYVEIIGVNYSLTEGTYYVYDAYYGPGSATAFKYYQEVLITTNDLNCDYNPI